MKQTPEELLDRAVALLQLCDAWIPRHATYHSRRQELYDVVVALQSLPELPVVETHRSRPKALPDGVEIGSRVVAKNPQGGIMHGWYQGYDPYTDGVNPHIIRRGEDDGIHRCRKVAPFGSSLMPEESTSSLPELSIVKTVVYTFDAAANAVLDRILNRFDIPFEGDFFDAIDAIAEYIRVMFDETKYPGHACCIVDGKPWFSMELPSGVVFVGMEKEPNKPPRYGKLLHPWMNKPCYETIKSGRE